MQLGTNDLADSSATAESIFQSIRQLHEVCHSYGIRTAALPIPPNKASSLARPALESYQSMRRRVNELLEEWAAAQAPQTIWVDVTAELPYSDSDGCWEADGLHLAPAGSEKLGRLLGEHVALREMLRG